MKAIIEKISHYRRSQTILVLLFVAIIHLTRSPEILISGRFWAEEGSDFFYNAWTLPPLKALFVSYGGYLNLATNLSTLIARWCVPLEQAPYITIGIGLLFQLLPSYLLLSAKDEWLSSFRVRLLAVLLLLFVPESVEISLHSLHIQFQLILACSIILVLDEQSTTQRWFHYSILLLTTLSSVMSIVLIPLYLLRGLIAKNKNKLIEFLILLVGNLIQFIFFYHHFKDRQYHFDIVDNLTIFFARDIYTPFFGTNQYSNIYLLHLQSLLKNSQFPLLACSISMMLLLLAVYCLYKYPLTRRVGYILIAALLNLTLSIYGALGPTYWFLEPYFCQRYVFISQSLLCLFLIYLIYALPQKGRLFCAFLAGWLLIVNIFNFYHFISYSYGAPLWRDQIKLWKQNPTMTIGTWPMGWKMKLPADHKR